IEALKREIRDQQAKKEERSRRAAQYDDRAKKLGLASCTDAEAFFANQRAIHDARHLAETESATAQNALTEAAVELRRLQDRHDDLQAELESLSKRRSNIRRQSLELPAALCRTMGLPEAELRV